MQTNNKQTNKKNSVEESREWRNEKKMSWSRCWTWVAALSLNPPSQTRFHQIYASVIPTLFLVIILLPETSLFRSPCCCWTGDWSFSRLLHRGQRDLIWLIPWVKFSSEISSSQIGTGFWFWAKLQGAHGTSPPDSIAMLPWQPQGNLRVLKLHQQPSENNTVLSYSQA